MKHNGFSLVEVLIYITLLAFMSIIACSWLSNCLHKSNQVNKQNQQIMMAHAILQRITQDIQMAEAKENRWNSTGRSLSLHTQDRQIRWSLEKNKLYRIDGRSKALMGTGTSDFNCRLHCTNGQVNGAHICLAFDDMNVEKEIGVRNGKA